MLAEVEAERNLSCLIARRGLAVNSELLLLEMINIQQNDEKTLETTDQTSHPSS